MRKIERIEMLIGKSFLFMLTTILATCWLIGCLYLINWIVDIMLHNFWITLLFVFADVVLIIKELKKI